MLSDFFSKLVMVYAHWKYKPVQGPAVDSSEIYRHMRFMGIDNVFISDSVFTLPRKEDVEYFLRWNIFKFRKYVPEKYDCDNYSFSLQGLFTNVMSGCAIGIVWAKTPKGNHALNFFIDDKGKFFYIEPQSNKVFYRSDYKPYLIIM